MNSKCMWARLVSIACGFILGMDAAVATEPAGGGKGVDLLTQLEEFDARIAGVRDLTANFEERKSTALLKKPLISTGRVRVKGGRSCWDTQKPHRTTMLIDGEAVRIYYPERTTLEVYEMNRQLQWLAISPLPRLAALREHFEIQQIAPQDIDREFTDVSHLALRLLPKTRALRDYVDHVDVVLDIASARVVRGEISDPDGDRTTLTFSDVRTNLGIDDHELDLDIPKGATVVRPLAALETKGNSTLKR